MLQKVVTFRVLRGQVVAVVLVDLVVRLADLVLDCGGMVEEFR